MIRQLSKLNLRAFSSRTFSTTPAKNNLVEVTVDDKTGYSTVSLNRPPVNSLNLELLSAISKTLDELLDNRTRGVILTSSCKTTFSAGLDIMEMYKPDPDRCKAFWSTLQDVWLKLYGAPFAVSCAINGHAPAGGCLLALSCEYRVMVPKSVIGLNETQLGIVAPTWFIDSMKNVIGFRQAEQALTLGSLFTTDQAKNIGLIDDVAIDKDDAIAKCTAWLDQFKKVNGQARGMTKQAIRSKTIQNLEENRSQDLQMFLYFVQQPKVQKSIEGYLEALKAKK